jgi:hypothetical protein
MKCDEIHFMTHHNDAILRILIIGLPLLKCYNSCMEENDELREEQQIRQLRIIVDYAESMLLRSDLSHRECINIVESTRKTVLRLFPGKEDVFNLIYEPRFSRVISERFSIPGTLSGRN